jgi:hypothetical protein
LNLASGSTDKAMLAAVKGHVIASGSFGGRYKRCAIKGLAQY